jgi:lactoylglutathione lyase
LRVTGPRHLVFTVANVDEAYAHLSKRGVDCLDPPASFDPPGIRIAYFRDPEGNVLGVYQDLDPANAIGGAS